MRFQPPSLLYPAGSSFGSRGSRTSIARGRRSARPAAAAVAAAAVVRVTLCLCAGLGGIAASALPCFAQTTPDEPPGGAAPAPGDKKEPRKIVESDTDILTLRGAADLRYRNANRATRGSYIPALRLTGDWVRRSAQNSDVRGGARVQFYLESDPPSTSTDRIRPSELYGFYNFALPGVSAQFRAGQFALPFGLTRAYDPLQPIQPLYTKALGLRVDTGIMLEGEFLQYRYAGSITTGSGPNRGDRDSGKVYTFRLSRELETRLGRFEVGGTLMSGKGPITTFATELPASGTIGAGAQDMVKKTRFAGDGQYFYGPLTARGEFVFGGDDEDPVWGYFAEGNYQVTPRLTAVAFRKRWTFPEKPQTATTTGVGINYDFGSGFIVRTLFEYERDVPLPAGSSPLVTKRIVIQTRLNF